jgi:hypothetical protein
VSVVASTHEDFAAETLAFLRRIRFEPARLDHRPVCALMRDVPFNFRYVSPEP